MLLPISDRPADSSRAQSRGRHWQTGPPSSSASTIPRSSRRCARPRPAPGASPRLEAEKDFDVTLLTGEGAQKVTARAITEAIDAYVRPPVRYRLLLVYFSGHGLWLNHSDHWLLSEAPRFTNEAINLSAAADLAKYCGIPNVVFVSDACRSLPSDLGTAQISGQDGFPFYEEIAGSSKVDVFRATGRAAAAYEGPVGDRLQSLLTAALLAAYDNPPKRLVRRIGTGRDRIAVVPNRKLKDFLQDKVDDLLAAISINLVQPIEADVPSDDDVYIARARIARPARAAPPGALTAEPAAAPVDTIKEDMIEAGGNLDLDAVFGRAPGSDAHLVPRCCRNAGRPISRGWRSRTWDLEPPSAPPKRVAAKPSAKWRPNFPQRRSAAKAPRPCRSDGACASRPGSARGGGGREPADRRDHPLRERDRLRLPAPVGRAPPRREATASCARRS